VSDKRSNPDPQRYIVWDCETRSRAPLKDVGAAEYARHRSTRILCAAYRVGTKEELPDAPTRVVRYWHGFTPEVSKFGDGILRPEFKLVAHNAEFEREIAARLIAPELGDPDRYICTASLAATHALPRALGDACDVLDLPAKKNPRGKLLIARHCKPRTPTKDNLAEWNDDEAGLEELARYCAEDVDATVGLFLALPPLHRNERRLWCLNQRFNARGIAVDREFVKAAIAIADSETDRLNAVVSRITGGLAPTQRDAVRAWLSENGAHLPNMQKKTIEDAIAAGLVTGDALTVLKARQMSSLTSLGKYPQFLQRTASDGRLRDVQLWHGASTGRDSGMGVQVQNFPRGTLDRETLDDALESTRTKDVAWVRALVGEPMAALSSCLRGCLIATPGQRLFSGDFNAIEARVAFWLAGHERGLDAFRNGVDLYVDQATAIYDKPHDAVTADEREIGKRAFLGCGYGMGRQKFQATCLQFNTPVSDATAKKAVDAYRSRHRPVVELWSNLEKAAIAATRNPGKRYTVNKTAWFVRGRFLYCQLPSGRRLAFFGPKLVYVDRFKNGEKKECLGFWSVNAVTKKWEFDTTYGGALCENICQAVARDRMMFAQLETESAGYFPLMSVHDELVNEREGGDLKEFESLMLRNPPWCEDLPTKVKVWSDDRYRKG